MRQFSIFHIPGLCFYSKALYRDVALNWRGVNFLYLLLLLSLCWALHMMKIQEGIAEFIDEDAPPIVKNIPAITITDGKVSVDAEEPCLITEPQEGKTLAIIDTTGEVTSLDGQEAMVLLLSDRVIVKKNDLETRIFELNEVKYFRIDSERILGWMAAARKWFVICLFPVVLIWSFMYRIVQALIFGAIALAFAARHGVQLRYGAGVRLAVVALTPGILIKTILWFAEVPLPGAGIVYTVVTLIFLYMGVQAAAAPDAPAIDVV